MDLQGRGVYRQHRIHTTRLFSGVWVVAVVHLGTAPPPGRMHAGPPVEHLRGEHPSEAEAIAAARHFIDRQVDTSPRSANDQGNTRPVRSPDPGPDATGDLFEEHRGWTRT